MTTSQQCSLPEKGLGHLDESYGDGDGGPKATKGSDFKTVVFPQSIFAIAGVMSAAAPVAVAEDDELPGWWEVARRVPLMLAWVWLHLLVEDIANQRLEGAIIEDSNNKPWRPLPSKRITPEEARRWLLMAIPVAVGASAWLGALRSSLCLMVLVWMYNDLDGSGSDIWLRNALNAGGLMCFSWGALAVLAQGEGQLQRRAYEWILLTGAVVMTTVHAQDFPDLEGDMARGRRTIPLLHGEGPARGSLAVMVVAWSIACPAFWGAALWSWAGPLSIGCAMAVLTLMRWGQWWDEVVWKLWCLWAASLYLLPMFAEAA
ncbi:hypothetical protein SODALDRAFT_324532 [Sodiomyces alkalinus F11]|uniref:UbiA prenyltransferase n=1 Tax=Sodiomyces alkalinus (strain CBS 110278 / VKM F-3762 / F11) TaxID=1314773 RepID=A0A3N2PUE4_SODAK|nr:hypothetical protein SODALDRAFT_324532 [Sodiomyces alkalinus F11]ROT38102.1 hypothetical protein SODALDRAFT_324532 [Sodiomyces alkalinus F11]